MTTLIVLGLVGLAAPAATAGAICLDKARGNLTLLFATDLTDAEIVLGKLAARLVPVLGLIACAAPVLALATLFGGVDPVDADRCDPGLAGLRRLRLHAGADAVGLGPEDARGAAGDLRLRHLLAAVGADLGGPGLDAALVGPAGLAAGLPGPAALQPRLPCARPARWSAGAGPDRAGGAGPVLHARAPDLGAAGRRGDLADPGGGHPAGRPGGGDAPGGPPGQGPPRPARPARPPAALAVTRRQPGTLARVASAAAVALVGRHLGPLRRALGVGSASGRSSRLDGAGPAGRGRAR